MKALRESLGRGNLLVKSCATEPIHFIAHTESKNGVNSCQMVVVGGETGSGLKFAKSTKNPYKPPNYIDSKGI